MAARIPNERFFPRAPRTAPRRPAQGRIAEETFYAAPRPSPEPSFLAITAATPRRFGAILLALGTAGVLMQASFLQQVVVGAPLFEEMAKLGLAILVASLLGMRAWPLRLALALASGGAFGVMEHHTTYPDETAFSYGERVAFHALTAGLAMSVFSLAEPARDARVRWLSTLPSTALHWMNNLGAVILGVLALAHPRLEALPRAWVLVPTTLAALAMLAALARPRRLREALAAQGPRVVGLIGLRSVEEDAADAGAEPRRGELPRDDGQAAPSDPARPAPSAPAGQRQDDER